MATWPTARRLSFWGNAPLTGNAGNDQDFNLGCWHF
jgi:hypothetical protein